MRVANAGPARISGRMMAGFVYGVENPRDPFFRAPETSRPAAEPVDPAQHVGPVHTQADSVLLVTR
jgi:hypothetical protein